MEGIIRSNGVNLTTQTAGNDDDNVMFLTSTGAKAGNCEQGVHQCVTKVPFAAGANVIGVSAPVRADADEGCTEGIFITNRYHTRLQTTTSTCEPAVTIRPTSDETLYAFSLYFIHSDLPLKGKQWIHLQRFRESNI